MAWADFTRLRGWKVCELGDNGANPWNLALNTDKLKFYGDGDGVYTGGDDDKVKKNGTAIASNATYNSSEDEVEVEYDATGDLYIIKHAPGELICRPKLSGGVSWTAVEE